MQNSFPFICKTSARTTVDHLLSQEEINLKKTNKTFWVFLHLLTAVENYCFNNLDNLQINNNKYSHQSDTFKHK